MNVPTFVAVEYFILDCISSLLTLFLYIADQHKRFRPTNFNPNNHLQNRRPVGMGVPGGQRHRSGSRGGKRLIRWNGREMSVQLHKTIVVKVLVCATNCVENRENGHRSFDARMLASQPNGVVILNSGGWRTMQTLTTINSVIKFIQLRIHYIGWSSCLFVLSSTEVCQDFKSGSTKCLGHYTANVASNVHVALIQCRITYTHTY